MNLSDRRVLAIYEDRSRRVLWIFVAGTIITLLPLWIMPERALAHGSLRALISLSTLTVCAILMCFAWFANWRFRRLGRLMDKESNKTHQRRP